MDHITIDWEPHGHPPAGIYTLPHFDAHFYMITPAQQAAITPGTNANSPLPDPRFVPRGYVSGVATVPFMGVHWSDVTGAEFNPPKLFDKTFIYGFDKGTLAFIEPMTSLRFLQSKPNFSAPIKQPQAFQRQGSYPTSYSIKYNASQKTYTISLDNLTPR